MGVDVRNSAIYGGVKWASKQKDSRPFWLIRLHPDVVRLRDKDGVPHAWIRNQAGVPEYVEVVWKEEK